MNTRVRRYQGFWLFAPLLAAALACNTSGGAAPTAQLILTSAAATASALAGPAATATPAPSTPVPTPAPPSATATQAPGVSVQLDPCSLMSQAEAEGLLGDKVGKATSQDGACAYADAHTRVDAVDFYAYPAAQAELVFEAHLFLLQAMHVKVDPAALAKLQKDSAAGETVAALNDLADMAIGQDNYHAERVDGLGRVALWSWNAVSTRQQAYLLAARPGAIVGMELVLGTSSSEASTKQAAIAILRRILTGLPDQFTVMGVTPTATDTPTPAKCKDRLPRYFNHLAQHRPVAVRLVGAVAADGDRRALRQRRQ